MKKVLAVSKTIIVCVFQINDIKKIKATLHSQSSPYYVVKISFLSYDCSLFGLFPRKTIFAILCICKTETTPRV